MGAKVELFGVDGSYFCLSGDGGGDQGVYLGTSPAGLCDAPVKVTYKSGAFEIGGTPVKKTIHYRELVLGLGAYAYSAEQWALVDSQLRKAFDYEVDPWDPNATAARLRVTTDQSGSRDLLVLLSESPVMDMDTDPHDYEHSLLPVTLVAGQPMWFQEDVIDSWELTSGSAGSGTVTIANPTDQPMLHTWVINGPAGATFSLPDVSWTGPRYARVPGVDHTSGRDDSERIYTTPTLVSEDGGGATVEVDRMRLPIRSLTNTNMAGRTGGRRLLYKVPPYTPPTEVPVSVTGGAPGSGVVLRQPRLWSRPWGLE
ncbi:hypothetical protein [Rhodococcus jostii]|uniref:hypothetical protein n=1 Tax=Rhodococcus jostii TaxID=132919 RepID=UPI0036262416